VPRIALIVQSLGTFSRVGATVNVARVRRPATFVLIHGAWHGAWCWHRLVPLLESAGHRVIAPDLPSMGEDRTPASSITLDAWARFVAELATRQPDPVVLVGHSRAGIVISQAAELAPERIARLVYLAAYLLPAGTSLAEAARADAKSLVPANMIPAVGGVTCTLRANVVREAFYGQCSDEDFEFARARLSPEPLKPLVTPLSVTPEKFGRVPRAYVECTDDRTISVEEQRRMYTALPCERVFSLGSDHSPFFSAPQELAGILISI
jgi:pimeloyl-ACP methyl ester carboxylesterase